MKLTTIETMTLNGAWWELLRACLKDGYKYTITRGSHNEGKKRIELDCASVHVTHPGIRPLAPTVPEGVPPPTSERYIEDYLPYLLSSEIKPNEEYTYGFYIEPQFLECLRMYKESGPNTNQACMTIGSKESIYLPDPPCLRVLDTRIREGKLHFYVYFRSWDLFGGFPTNMGGLQLMKEQMAKELGVEDGELFAFSKGLHLYDHAIEMARIVTGLEG